MILSSPDLLGRFAEISQGFKQALPAQGAHGLPEPLVGGAINWLISAKRTRALPACIVSLYKIETAL
jgi:hypothetical protein